MTRLTPSVLLTPDPEGMYMHMDEVKKLVKREREACAKLAVSLRYDLRRSKGNAEAEAFNAACEDIADNIRSRNEESK